MSQGSEPSARAKAEIRMDEKYAEATERRGNVIHATYVLTLHSPLKAGTHQLSNELLRETEENLTDLLPPGWWVEIREWNEQREGDDDD